MHSEESHPNLDQHARELLSTGGVWDHLFERELNLIEAFYVLGVRQTLLAFNNANCAGGGCADRIDSGLTAYGRRFIREAERVGMLIDLSHVGRQTSLDALEIAQKPM